MLNLRLVGHRNITTALTQIKVTIDFFYVFSHSGMKHDDICKITVCCV